MLANEAIVKLMEHVWCDTHEDACVWQVLPEGTVVTQFFLSKRWRLLSTLLD
jgi:hypothetical protein